MDIIDNKGKRALKNIMVTGGAGFIGSNFIRYLFGMGSLDPKAVQGFAGKIVNFDFLTYAGNLKSLDDLAQKFPGRYFFEKGDIANRDDVKRVIEQYEIDTIVHFAAESHVDRSILGPEAFIRTNVMGTFVLLDVAKEYWKNREDVLFHHVSTDEVFGSLGETGFFYETTPYDPRSPYSASKASSDHIVQAYLHTYGLPITMSNCSNNYGPYQFPEKLIPVMVLNMLDRKALPVYGDGKNIRDWLYVEDHNSAVWTIMTKGITGETYNIGGENEWENITLLQELIELTARLSKTEVSEFKKLITFVKDRPGHDRRYAINCDKLKKNLGWKQSVTFNQGLEKTVAWYLANTDWINSVRDGSYKHWMEKNYSNRS